MKSRISQILAPPVFEGDEKKTGAAVFLNVILWTMIIGSVLAMPLIFIAPPGTMPSRLVALISLLLLSFSLRGFMRRGHIRMVSIMVVLGLWVVTNLAILFGGGGVRSIGFPGNIIVVLMAGILLGRQAALGSAALCIATGVGFLVANQYGLLPNLPIQDTDMNALIIYSVHIIVAAVLLGLSLRNTDQALARARQEIEERVRVQEQLSVSEQKYRNYIEQSTEGIWLVAFDEPIPTSLPSEEQVRLIQSRGYIAECNNSLARMYGFTSSREMIGYRLFDLYGGQPNETNFQSTLRLVRDGYRSAERLTEEVNAHREKVYFLNNAVGVIKDDHLVGMWGTQRDVTERIRAEESLRRQAHELSLLYEFGISLAAGQDLYSTLRALQEEISQLIPTDSFFVAIYDDSTNIVSYPIAFDLGVPLDEPPRSLKERPGLTGAVIFSGKTLYLPDSMTPEAEDAYQPVDHTRMVLHTFLGVPLVSKGRVIGALSVQSQEINAYTPDQIQLVENLAVQAALAIDKASLLEQLQHELGERKRAEEALRQANLVVESSPVVLFRWKAEAGWLVLLVSQNITQFGYTSEELLSGAILYASIVHPDDLERIAREVQQYSAGGVDRFQQEYRIITKDGRVRWVDDRTFVARDSNGNIIHYQGTVMDITEQKKAEQVRLASHQIAEAALLQNLPEFYQSVHDIISSLIPARNFYITLYNAASGTFSNPFLVDEFDSEWPSYRPGKGLGSYVMRTGKPLLASPEVFTQLERQGEVEIVHRRMVEWLGVPLKTRQGKIFGVMAVQNYSGPPRLDSSHMDLMMFVSVQVAMAIERMQVEAEREKLIQELTAKNAELEQFTYTVSHDLKAPLITIRGFLGYLDEDASSGNRERLKDDIERIGSASTKMYKLLDELLILSRIGRMKNPPVNIPFAEIVHEALGMVEGRLRPRRIEVRIEPGLPIVHGDRPRLVEILQNLIDNAAKFIGERPDPCIEIGQRGFDADGKPILFVHDNGIGIDPQYHDKVFGLFNKLDMQTEGTGVGLALVKRIIEVHECRIWIESEPGKGSTFYFTLPNESEPGAGA